MTDTGAGIGGLGATELQGGASGLNPYDTSGGGDLGAKLKLAGKALGATPTDFDPDLSGGGGSSAGSRMGSLPTLSSLDNLIRILERQKSLGAHRRAGPRS
jgi:hypothetical protein